MVFSSSDNRCRQFAISNCRSYYSQFREGKTMSNESAPDKIVRLPPSIGDAPAPSRVDTPATSSVDTPAPSEREVQAPSRADTAPPSRSETAVASRNRYRTSIGERDTRHVER